ncbi:MAG: NTF2 fold immunity protein [Candidatus Acidiferrales bacterium]
MKDWRKPLFLALAFLMIGMVTHPMPQSFKPKDGFVSDEKTAIAVARAILNGVYGEKQISAEEPLSASLRGETWTVKGTPHMPNGGVAEIEISKETGKVLRVTHGK